MHFFCEGERRGETFGLWVRLFTVGEKEALLRMQRTLQLLVPSRVIHLNSHLNLEKYCF